MMTTRLILCALCCVLLLSCSGDKAKDLLETAEFEERQMNLPHAKQLYEDVIRSRVLRGSASGVLATAAFWTDFLRLLNLF